MISNIRGLFLCLSADKWQLVVIAVNVSQRYIAYLGFLRPAAQCIDIGLCHSCCFLATIQCRATGPQGGQKIRVNSERRSGKRHTKSARGPESSREARVCQRLGERKRETPTVHAANSWCCECHLWLLHDDALCGNSWELQTSCLHTIHERDSNWCMKRHFDLDWRISLVAMDCNRRVVC